MTSRIGIIVVAATLAVGASAVFAATASADDFTPSIEEPTAQLGVPGSPSVLGSDGNHSSAQGQNGASYGSAGEPDGNPGGMGQGGYGDGYSGDLSRSGGDGTDPASDDAGSDDAGSGDAGPSGY
jgi:hypothetical protein